MGTTGQEFDVRCGISRDVNRAAGRADKFGMLTITDTLIRLQTTSLSSYGPGLLERAALTMLHNSLKKGSATLLPVIVLDTTHIQARYDMKRRLVSVTMPNGEWLILSTTPQTPGGRAPKERFQFLVESLRGVLGDRLTEHRFPGSRWNIVIACIIAIWILVLGVLAVVSLTGSSK